MGNDDSRDFRLADDDGSVIAYLNPRHGMLRITGRDALDLLNRITTNSVDSLAVGEVVSTVLTNPDARVIDLLTLARLEDCIWCITSEGRAHTVVDWIDTFTFGEEISVEDLSDSSALLLIGGSGVVDFLELVEFTEEADLVTGHVATNGLRGFPVEVIRTDIGGADGYAVLGSREAVAAVSKLCYELGASNASDNEWERYRVGNGMPKYGAEFGEFNNPLEARLTGVISDNKGCYTGQEVIARLQTYKKIQRALMSVTSIEPLESGMKLIGQEKDAGTITSAATVPDGSSIALALVRTAFAQEGTELSLGEIPSATVVLHDPLYALRTESSS